MGDLENPGLVQTKHVKDFVHAFFLGTGLVASFAAIGNVMIVEEDFEELLKEFKPSLKFWGTKMLVSLACMQSMVIGACFGSWGEVRSNLLYSSMLRFECFLIAIFHCLGWRATDAWYGDYEVDHPAARREASKRNLLASKRDLVAPLLPPK